MVFLHGGAFCPAEAVSIVVVIASTATFCSTCYYAARYHLKRRNDLSE